ncbi:MAG: class I SAM-dependent methyltransferase [Candidatus Thorarchaeota archaeon]|jgi:ubiquinone/menaquinone biosynthesis C-methylase UbiE
MTIKTNNYCSSITRNRYQRISSFYDLMEILPERRYISWREKLWSLVKGPEVLEVGIGTGKNIAFYTDGVKVTGVDLTPGMLERARNRVASLKREVTFLLGDAQSLEFPAKSFDTIVATFVFCSVADPVQGLREVYRVAKPGGQVLLLEHVRSNKPVLGEMMDFLNPVLVRITGANINRRTVDNVRRAGLIIDHIEDLGMGDIYKLIIAHREERYV